MGDGHQEVGQRDRCVQIRFSHDSLLDWSDPDEGVQIVSEAISDDIAVVAVSPHPMSGPDVASPTYYYFQSISTGGEILPSEISTVSALVGLTIEVSYERDPLPHASTVFAEEEENQQKASRIKL